MLSDDIKKLNLEKGSIFYKASTFFFENQIDSSFLYSSQAYNEEFTQKSKLINYILFIYGVSASEKGFNTIARKKLKEITNDFSFRYLVNLNLGSIHLDEGQFKDALEYSLLTLESDKIQDNYLLKGLYHNIGVCYLHLKRYNESEKFLLKELFIAEKEKDTFSIVGAKMDLGNLFYEQYKDDIAIDYFEQSYQLAKKFKDIELRKFTSKNMAVVEKNRKRFKESIDYYTEYEKWKDSLWNRDRISELVEKDKQISIALKDKELFIQTEKTAKQTRRLQWGGGILVLAILFLVTLFYSYKTKVKQNQIITAQKGELEKLNHTKNYLFSVISHDLRSPVKMLIKQQQGFLKKIKKGETETLEETAGSALTIAESLNHLLNNVLHWSLEQNDQMIFNPQVQPIFPVINQVLFDFRLLAEEKGITLESDLDDEAFINIDRESIKVVLRNLLDNAIKYTPENGTIMVSTAIEGDQCQIQVADSGMGISEEQLERINSLQELSIDKINRSKGIGLGLLLCTTLIKKNGGSFQVSAELNKGTHIQMTFPIAEEV